MNRRIALTALLIATAAIAVAVTVAGVVLRRQAADHAEAAVAEQARSVRTSIGLSDPDADVEQLQARARSCAALSQAGVRPDGSVRARLGALGPLPAILDVAALRGGRVVTSRADDTVFAGFACDPERRFTNPNTELLQTFVVSRPIGGPAGLVPALASGGVAAAALGGLAALAAGRWLTRPLRRLNLVAASMAGGDLEARADDRHGSPDLTRLGASLNKLASQLDRSQALEQQFLLSISHDLRTPLTSIRGYAEAIADGTLSDVGKGVAVIEQEAQRLERLVRDLLDLARLEARQFRLELTEVDLVDVGVAAVAAFANAAARAEIRLEFVPAGTRPALAQGDRDRLGQVVANLVENALRFAISTVVVTAGGDGDEAWLAVSDDGPGIPEVDLPHVFERLYVSASHPVRSESGSGLGLAIVAELCAAMGGTVSAEPGSGRGTAMRIRFPRLNGNHSERSTHHSEVGLPPH
jgi:signal transduction histidine kinase